MTLIIEQPDAVELLQAWVAITGEDESEAVTRALRERLMRESRKQTHDPSIADDLLRIGRECAALPVLDDRTPEQILGFEDESPSAKRRGR